MEKDNAPLAHALKLCGLQNALTCRGERIIRKCSVEEAGDILREKLEILCCGQWEISWPNGRRQTVNCEMKTFHNRHGARYETKEIVILSE